MSTTVQAPDRAMLRPGGAGGTLADAIGNDIHFPFRDIEAPPLASPGLPLDDLAVAERRASGTLRLLVVDQSGQLGGGELALLPLLKAWSTRCELVLFTDGPLRERAAESGVRVNLLLEPRVSAIKKKGTKLSALFAFGALRRQIYALALRANSADVIYLNSQKALVLGAIAGGLSGKPVVWHVHDIMSTDHFSMPQLSTVRFIVRRFVDHIIANSAASSASVQALTGLPPDRISVLHNGISAAPFESLAPDCGPSLRRSLRLSETTFTVGLFGRLSPWKGAHIALHAIAMVPGAHLLIVGKALFGEQAYEAALKRQVATLGIADRVQFLGFRDDIPALMKMVDVVLHASTAPEPFGRVIVEGMLARRPVVATAAGGVLEILRHRQTGWLVPPDDPYAIADALLSLQSAPAWARQLGERAFEEAAVRFAEQEYVDAISAVLDGARST